MIDANRKRILIYSHDTYGLGHFRRSLLVAQRLVRAKEAPLVLIVTGSPRAQAFRMPEGCDCLKLPAITKDPAGNYRPRTLGVSLEQLLSIRSGIIRGAVRGFKPDLILVDHAPVGVEGELIPLFNDLLRGRRRPKVVLGLRDVIDEVGRVEQEWERLGVRPYLEIIYDRILVYGDPQVTSTAHELGLPAWFPTKVRFTGYLGRSFAAVDRPKANGKLPLFVVTVGGGGDGQRVLRGYAKFLEKLEQPASFRSLVVMGPFLSARRQREIMSRFDNLSHPVEIISFTNQMDQRLLEATGVVSMGGYNSVMEILAAGLPALVVPRNFPRREQRLRAERVEPYSNIEVAQADEDLPGRMAKFVRHALGHPERRAPRLHLGGLDAVTSELMTIMGVRRASPIRITERTPHVRIR